MIIDDEWTSGLGVKFGYRCWQRSNNVTPLYNSHDNGRREKMPSRGYILNGYVLRRRVRKLYVYKLSSTRCFYYGYEHLLCGARGSKTIIFHMEARVKHIENVLVCVYQADCYEYTGNTPRLHNNADNCVMYKLNNKLIFGIILLR